MAHILECSQLRTDDGCRWCQLGYLTCNGCEVPESNLTERINEDIH